MLSLSPSLCPSDHNPLCMGQGLLRLPPFYAKSCSSRCAAYRLLLRNVIDVGLPPPYPKCHKKWLRPLAPGLAPVQCAEGFYLNCGTAIGGPCSSLQQRGSAYWLCCRTYRNPILIPMLSGSFDHPSRAIDSVVFELRTRAQRKLPLELLAYI